MEQEPLHLPDFTVPTFTQPDLARADLARPDFVLPNADLSVLQQAHQVPLWPADVNRPQNERPDPLLEPERPDTLAYPAADAHAMPEPENAPEVVMQQRPGELDPAALSMTLTGPDEASLPAGLAYPRLYTSADEMSRRKRRFAMLELGLQQNARNDDHAY